MGGDQIETDQIETDGVSPEQHRKGSGSSTGRRKREDLEISGISPLRDRDSNSVAASRETSLKSDVLLNESLLSFRRHEEELLRTDITQDDLVLSFNSSDVRRSLEAQNAIRRSRELPLQFSTNAILECSEVTSPDDVNTNMQNERNSNVEISSAQKNTNHGTPESKEFVDVVFVDDKQQKSSDKGGANRQPTLQE